MVELIDDMPAGTLGFRVSGKVRKEDYTEVLIPRLHAAAEAGGPMRTLYEIQELDAVEPSALWSDSKLGFDLAVRHHDVWERSAIVTDVDWIAHSMKVFGWMIPGDARIFPGAELEEAKAWVAQGSS